MGSPTTTESPDRPQLGTEHSLYQYPGQPLQETDAFRLVTILPGEEESSIRCRLFNARLQDAPKYEALSYTWGEQSNRSTVTFDEPSIEQPNQLSVTANSVSALRRLRYIDTPRTVWIDQICINQADTQERNHQLRLMTRIYTEAEGVVIYLGESQDDSDLAMDIIGDIHAPSDDSEERVLKPNTDMLQSLFDRPWFNRIWVLQEVAMARSAVVNCGRKSLSWDAFRTFSSWNVMNGWVKNLPYVVQHERERMSKYHVEDDLMKKLVRTRGCGASDPRDKVYAVLPLISQSESKVELVPDYGLSPAAVFTDVAEKFLANFGIEILCQVQAFSQLPGLPSWVPDWSIAPRTNVLGFGRKSRFTPPFKAGGLYTPNQLPKTKTWYAERINLDTVHVQLRAQGIGLGKISALGDKCDISLDYFPIRKWNDIAVLSRTNSNDFDTVNGTKQAWKDRGAWSMGSLSTFELTLTMENIVYPDAVRDGMGILFENDGAEQPVLPLKKCLSKSLPPSYARQASWILEACDGRRFFLIEGGQMGLAPSEARNGDVICVLLGASVPFVLRPEGSAFRLVGECYVQGIMKGEALPPLNQATSGEEGSNTALEEYVIR